MHSYPLEHDQEDSTYGAAFRGAASGCEIIDQRPIVDRFHAVWAALCDHRRCNCNRFGLETVLQSSTQENDEGSHCQFDLQLIDQWKPMLCFHDDLIKNVLLNLHGTRNQSLPCYRGSADHLYASRTASSKATFGSQTQSLH